MNVGKLTTGKVNVGMDNAGKESVWKVNVGKVSIGQCRQYKYMCRQHMRVFRQVNCKQIRLEKVRVGK